MWLEEAVVCHPLKPCIALLPRRITSRIQIQNPAQKLERSPVRPAKIWICERPLDHCQIWFIGNSPESLAGKAAVRLRGAPRMHDGLVSRAEPFFRRVRFGSKNHRRPVWIEKSIFPYSDIGIQENPISGMGPESVAVRLQVPPAKV